MRLTLEDLTIKQLKLKDERTNAIYQLGCHGNVHPERCEEVIALTAKIKLLDELMDECWI